MTDAQRLADAWTAVDDIADPVEAAQRLIDSGVVTVNPPPDPAEQIAAAYLGERPNPATVRSIRRLIGDGWITPGPRCGQ